MYTHRDAHTNAHICVYVYAYILLPVYFIYQYAYIPL